MKSYKKYREAVACVKASKDIKQAVLSIPDSYAQSMPAPRRHGWVRLAAMAAVIAIIIGVVTFWPGSEENFITGPGLLSIEAHAVNEETGEVESFTLRDGIDIPGEYRYHVAYNYHEDLKLTVNMPSDAYGNLDISIEIKTETGTFERYGNNDPFPFPPDTDMSTTEQLLHTLYGQHFTVPNGTAVYWSPIGIDYELIKENYESGKTDFDSMGAISHHKKNPSYIDIIIRAGKYIVGYGVIAVTKTPIAEDPVSGAYSFDVLEIKSFPLVDGQFQHVPVEYVESLFEEIHEGK